ncbi:MAG: PLP-dependent aminotransferase family protein [Propionicimonas sp.]|uniref:MocR-like transcription factor YczR n=1 Tax=Propionicimonas sp. TaxID=1955623 RepID=UPI003D0D9FED
MTAPATSAARLVQLLGRRESGVPAYRWLADGLRRVIADGRVPAGHALPSERRLSEALDASRTTVTRAYALLVETGFLVARHGSGHVVTLPLGRERLGVGGALLPGTGDAEDVLDLTCAAGRAPAGTAEAYAAALDALPSYLAGTGYATAGLPELRELIAARYAERGLPTAPDQVMIVGGGLAGVGLAVRALSRPGDRVLVESPSYPNSIDATRRSGARLVPLPVDPTGWDLDLAAATIAAATPVVAQFILDFHNPTGALMPDADRERLAAALRRAGTVAVVDETMLEVRLDEGPVPLPFAAHLSRCVLVGSASKSHWGGLRIGWLRVPRPLLPQLAQARIADDLGAPVLEQLALVQLLRRGHGLHPERRDELRAARATMVAALRDALPGARWVTPAGGLFLWVELPEPRANQLAAAARNEDLLVSPGPQFAVSHGLQRYVRLPYKDPPEVVAEAMRRLGRAWRAQASLPSGPVASRPRPVVA